MEVDMIKLFSDMGADISVEIAKKYKIQIFNMVVTDGENEYILNYDIDKYKLFFTTSYSTNAINPPEIIKAQPNEICTETFLLVGPFDTEKEQLNCLKYMNTKFFKFLLYLGKGTMHVTKSVFGLIPLQDFDEEWTDEKLYRKYGLTAEEIAYIEKMVRPME